MQTEDRLARVAAVERSRREAAEARAAARAASEQREAAAAAEADPAIAAQAARAPRFATAGSSGILPARFLPRRRRFRGSSPAFADFADFDSAAAAGAYLASGGNLPGADAGRFRAAAPTEPEGPPSVNTAHDLARARCVATWSLSFLARTNPARV